ncbi:MAG: zinc ribbon domain-containing protein [Planctomycetes bacterium]|nr:zinc ribbon domain-containing protein [Planctomycetota bacterium]
MPTYEYACPTCGIVEVFQSIKEAPLKKCPQCKKQKVTRIVSGGSGVIFKGSGFWETDYNRSSDYQKKTKDESGSQPADGKSESKTEAKPEKAPAAKPADPAPAAKPVKPDTPPPAPKPSK